MSVTPSPQLLPAASGPTAPGPVATPIGGRSRRNWLVAVCVGIPLLALIETLVALVAPNRAPNEADWKSAAQAVRKAYRAGDFLVAAPAWSDQLMRLHLGDLLTLEQIARPDLQRLGRIWEVSQRGAQDAAVRSGRRLVSESRHGALAVRLYEKKPATLVTDFVQALPTARVAREFPLNAALTPCPLVGTQYSCPNTGFEAVLARYLEIDFLPRRVVFLRPTVQPSTAGTRVRIEYPAALLGKELLVAAGMGNAWWREVPGATGTVELAISVDGKQLGNLHIANRSGQVSHTFDTTALAGRTMSVVFTVTSEKPYARQFGFAAEARNP